MKTIVFTGGESAMKKEIYSMIKYARDLGLKVNIISNGLIAYNKEKAQLLKEYCNKITISLDSLDSELNDRNRGKNCFRIAKRAIDNLLEVDFKNLAINQTVTNVNYHSIEDMENFTKRHEIQLNVGPYCEMGRGKTSEFSLTKNERIEIDLKSLKTKNQLLPLNVKVHCGQGIGEFSIDPIGNIYTCKLLDTPHFLMGNLRVKSIQEIIGDDTMLERAMKQSVNKFEKCSECSFKYLCGGSCRASHYSNTDNNALGILDDECAVIKEMLKEHMWQYFREEEAVYV